MDLMELVAFGVVGFLSGIATSLYLFYHLKTTEFFENVAFNFMQSLANDEELQKTVYQVGGMFGSGVKGGIGIDLPAKNRGGRFKWQDIALDLASQYLSKTLANPSPSPDPLPLPLQGKKDKFFNS